MVCKSKGNTLIAEQIETDCQEFSGLIYKRPIDRGYLIDCELQYVIWEHIFQKIESTWNVQPTDSTLLLTRQPFIPTTIQMDIEQLVFEHFGFNEFCSLSCAYLNFYNCLKESKYESIARTGSALVVDSGFSFTHVIPIVNHHVHVAGIKRIDVGGKALTNYLKETISLRYYDMREETYLVNLIKEHMCKASLDFIRELNDTEFSHRLKQVYVLPDYQKSMTGYIVSKKAPPANLSAEQTLTLNNERIAVPEILFHPSDIGMEQAGIPEAIYNSISTVDNDVIQSVLYDAIVLVGGNCKFKNFEKRVQQDVRRLAPIHMNVHVQTASDPITNCWYGGAKFASLESEQVKSQHTVSKAEYEEYGHNICQRRFIL